MTIVCTVQYFVEFNLPLYYNFTWFSYCDECGFAMDNDPSALETKRRQDDIFPQLPNPTNILGITIFTTKLAQYNQKSKLNHP